MWVRWTETDLICMHEQPPRSNYTYQSCSACSTGFMTFCGIPLARYSMKYMDTRADAYKYARSLFTSAHRHSLFQPQSHTRTHARRAALCQAVSAVWHQLSCLIISFSERCPVPSTKTNMAAGDKSINQMGHLPIVIFHLQLMCIECLRKVSNNAQTTFSISNLQSCFDRWVIRVR